jgi:hypothetical protein
MEPAPRPDLSAQRRVFAARAGAERAAVVDVATVRAALDAALTQRRGPGTDRTAADGQTVAARTLRSALAEGVAERNGPTS